MTRGFIEMRVKIVLWDLGRVLVDWEPERAYLGAIPDAPARRDFLDNICTMAWHARHDEGISFADNAEWLIARHPEHEALIRRWGDHWFDMFDGYIDGTPALFDRLAQTGIAQYALSNMPADDWPEMKRRFPLLTRFNDAIISGEEKVIKPNPEIYQIALRRMGSPPSETVLFIDDSAANIEAASKLGFQTHLMKNASGLETALMHYKLLP
jgi:HAD superfamily hydrolase (TIGR01549 family)